MFTWLYLNFPTLDYYLRRLLNKRCAEAEYRGLPCGCELCGRNNAANA